ncbi:MAG: extracellular solute-binding protein [Rhodospirillaceae bacterium]|nr:MAG: extracellular solute-binding protein [Rhodospirillaceae bacterium]
MPHKKRKHIGLLLAGLVVASIAGGSAKADDEKKLVISSWGGAFTKATLDNFVTPFAKEKGIDYQMVDASGKHLAQVQAQTSAGKITWDVIDSLDEATAALMYKRGLLETIPPDVKKVLEENSAPGMVTDFGVMLSSIANPIICNNEKVKACPSNAAEFFDTDKFPGERSADSNVFDMLILALKAVGVGDRAPTDEELDKAFALIEKVQPSLRTLWDSGEQSMQIMRNGEAVITQIWNRPARKLVEESPGKYTVNWQDAPYGPAYIVVVKGAPHPKLAFQYMEYYATHPEQQAKWSSTTSYGVANPKALASIDPAAKEWLPESHLKSVTHGNIEWWIENQKAMVQRWRQVIGGS